MINPLDMIAVWHRRLVCRCFWAILGNDIKLSEERLLASMFYQQAMEHFEVYVVEYSRAENGYRST